MTAAPGARRIRSFVQRARRLSPRSEEHFAQLWSRFGIALPEAGAFDPVCAFSAPGPVTMEIGFGRGEVLLAEAQEHPERRLLGVEVYRPGVHRLLCALERADVDNVRILCTDAAPLLARLPDACLAGIRMLFPDPWPKTRHHKRRLVTEAFVLECARIAAPGALLHIATDWRPYALAIDCILQASAHWRAGPAPPPRPLTHFEARGRRRGHAVHEFVRRRAQQPTR